eukprot:357069-Chlamydomonas_euryale.AAC.3
MTSCTATGQLDIFWRPSELSSGSDSAWGAEPDSSPHGACVAPSVPPRAATSVPVGQAGQTERAQACSISAPPRERL